MKTSRFAVTLSLMLSGAPFANADESLYLVNQKSGESRVSAELSIGDSQYAGGRSRLQALGVEYRRALDERQSVWGRTQMMGRQFTTSGQGHTGGTGLSDIELGYKNGRIYDVVTLVYGGTLNLSPGATQDPRLGRVDSSNSFSGTQSAAGYLGFESYSEALAVGGQAEVRMYSDIRALDGTEVITVTNRNRLVPRFSGFVEIPVSRDFDLGFEGALARSDLSVDKYLLGGAGNQYEAAFYGNYDLDRDTRAVVRISAKSQKYPLAEESFDIGVGLQRGL
ncbi:MAG: hypothetical protein KF767_12415 [Bdellovibrionaceae bacterium]|nr:hypothetical protein [Pseudobdellovibrionaceae bacterium]